MMITPPVPDRLFVWRIDRATGAMVACSTCPTARSARSRSLRPFFGTIGTAPAGKECISSLVPGSHGANMDFNEVIEG